MILNTHSKAIINTVEEEELFGRLGFIRESFATYNRALPEQERQLKYQKMAVSPFSFFRGSNHLFWRDFEWDWRMNCFGNHRTRTWVNGDCHAYNFGAYQLPTGEVIYDLNDFDEAVVADYQYDLWRLAISLVLIPDDIARLGEADKFPKIKTKKVLEELADSYLETLFDFADNREADETAYTVKNTTDPLHKFLKRTIKKEGRHPMLAEWTKIEAGQPKFNLAHPDVEKLDTHLEEQLQAAFPHYLQTVQGYQGFPIGYFEIHDMVRRTNAGTGSLGSERYYVLIEGDPKAAQAHVILDVKEIVKPSACAFQTESQRTYFKQLFPHEGIRFTEAYRALGYHPDQHLGWLLLNEKYFSIRQRNPYKKSFKVPKYVESSNDYVKMAKQWGKTLATAHSRANKVNGYALGNEVKKLTKGRKKAFRKILREVGEEYASIVQTDYELFVAHIAK